MTPNRVPRWLAIVATLGLPCAATAQQRPAAPAPAANPTAQATLLGQFGDWGAYTAAPNGQKICFALSKPTSMTDNPPNRRNASMAVYLFVSSRPADKVKDEISVLVTNYVFKSAAEASATVGGASFSLHTQNDGAWVKAAADEPKLIDAMRKGADLVVKSQTSRGTATTDTFSLKGISQALDRVAQECQ